jgi:copper chaperone NosL
MKRLFYQNLFWLVPLAFLVAGCHRPTAIVPPEIHYGRETCADCGMIVNDAHYAAAIAFRTEPDAPVQSAIFDDIGCLLTWRQHHREARVAAAWVKDVNTAAWLEATSAAYVKSDQFSTPMGSGVVAGSAVSDFAKLPVQSPALTWSNLLNADSLNVGSLPATGAEPTH